MTNSLCDVFQLLYAGEGESRKPGESPLNLSSLEGPGMSPMCPSLWQTSNLIKETQSTEPNQPKPQTE